jgi:alpha-D-xyloside xylohydrolase
MLDVKSNTMIFTKMIPGIWKAHIEFPWEAYSPGGLLERSGNSPGVEALAAQEERGFPFAKQPQSGFFAGKCILRFPLGEHERLYGLGLGYQKLEQTMQAKHLRSDHYGGTDNGRTHVPTPFYISDAGYGVFIDCAAVVSFYTGAANRLDAENPPPEKNRSRDDDWISAIRSDCVEVSFNGAKTDVYIFAAPTMKETAAKFNLLCGGGCLPPKWGFGFWHRVNMRYSAEDVKREAAEFKAHDIPLSVIGLEPGWQSNTYPCTHEWDAERFPDPSGFINEMAEQGIRINIWENLYISKKAALYPKIKPYCGSHTVWGGAVPDFTLDEARKLVADQHRRDHLDAGISGYKIDECDGYDSWLWPDHAEFPSGIPGDEMRQILAPLFARLTKELYREKGIRTYGLIRAANAGMQPLPYCIYNDCYDFSQYMTGLVSCGFSGALWCPEMRDARSAEEWVRRFQMAVLSPMMMLNGWANSAQPWLFPEVLALIRKAILLRYELLPYLYTAFAAYRFRGIPPFRALCMDFSSFGAYTSKGILDGTDNPYKTDSIKEITDQYMAGESLMVAPAFTRQTRRAVIFPRGVWFDYYTGERIEGGRTITVDCPLEKLPLFVRGGKDHSLIPLISEGRLTARCYGEEGSFELYDDDGETYKYEEGEQYRAILRFVSGDKGVEGMVEPLSGGFDSAAKGFLKGGVVFVQKALQY